MCDLFKWLVCYDVIIYSKITPVPTNNHSYPISW